MSFILTSLGSYDASTVKLCILNQFLSEGSETGSGSAGTKSNSDVEFTLENLWKILQNPAICAANLHMKDIEIQLRELNMIDMSTLLVDLTHSIRTTNFLTDILIISKRAKNTRIICCSTPNSATFLSEAEMTNGMLSDLMIGVPVDVQYGSTTETHMCRAGALVFSPSSEKDCSLSSTTHSCLRAVASVQRSCNAPCFIDLRNATDSMPSILSTLSASGANMSQIVLHGTYLSLRNVREFLEILLTYPCCICIDNFGDVSRPLAGLPPPSDYELVEVVLLLLKSGISDSRIILSVAMNYRIQLTQYGGPGYGHTIQSVVPRLLSTGLSQDTVHALVAGNMVRVLSWYVPPPPAVICVPTFTCALCGKSIEAGKQFEKLTFVYCSSNCISNHRKAGWKQEHRG